MMMMRKLTLSMAVLLAVVLAATATSDSRQAAQPPSFSRPAMDARVPVVAEHWYTLNARVRPLLVFWIRRDNVGSGRLTWRAEGPEHRALEFLVGSDPARAPRKINRWGYIAEEVHGTDAMLLGLMTQADEQTTDEAEAEIAAEAQPGQRIYKAIRTVMHDGIARGGVSRVAADRALTYQDLDTILDLVDEKAGPARAFHLSQGTRPGFLVATSELVDRTREACRAGTAPSVHSVPYVYNHVAYDLTLESCEFAREYSVGGRRYDHVVRAELATRNTVTKNRTRFQVAYFADGASRGVPVRMVFRPRWWFEAELLLDQADES